MDEKILYIWDLAGTLFYECWDAKRTGFPTYDKWLENKTGKKLREISNREYEEMYEVPYKEGWFFKLNILPGFKEVLTLTKNNEAFTTGIPEQMNWRAHYLSKKVGFDVRKYLKKINTTFDYGETNKKTQEMLIDYLNKKYTEGYRVIVYTDDKLKNCLVFLKAASEVMGKHNDFSFRIYNVLNNKSRIENKGDHFEVGSLFDLLENENKLR